MEPLLNDDKRAQVMAEVRRAKTTMHKIMTATLANVNLTHEQCSVMSLIEHEHLNQKAIAQRLHITEATLSVRIKRLESLGFIERVPDEKDKRQYALKVTAQGRKELSVTHEKVHDIIIQMFDGFTEEDFDHLMSMINRLTANCERIGGTQ